ncbi:membrane protein [Iodidimonas gelatinilytica]|uniref:Membrane protein n=1 Tax=Iodidimonas gelatinilytica TaxID=1236966 RepID=A0A5A7N3Y6_9PROT|nr:SLC13 family permease [Iodidimonas gelatinilytica]GEQ98341.1 membrane protein [Iodidimonas gelatinilytica]GER02080.1 membrane protein [Iodidimonas gelatinilytica]
MIAADPSIQMWITFAVIAFGMVLYAIDRISMELSSLAIIVALLIVFQIFPITDPASGDQAGSVKALIAGFADPALMAILSLLVMGQALVVSGALDEPVRRLVGPATSSPRLVLFSVLAIVLLFSGFLNNTPVVAIFIPILNALAGKMNMNPSRVMIPLSYAAILGGNLTLIGSSANLLVASSYAHITGENLGFFTIFLPGLMLGVVGFIYVAFIAPHLLTDRATMSSQFGGSSKQFLVQLEVTYGGALEGLKATSGLFPGLTDVTIRCIRRDDEVLLPPFHDMSLLAGDTLVAAATRQSLTQMMLKSPELLSGAWHTGGVGGASDSGEGPLPGRESMMAEVMIAPASRLQGRTLEQVGFRSLTNCVVLGIQRRSRMIRSHTAQLVLEPGDVLLLIGSRNDIHALRGNRDLLLLEWSASDFPAERNSGVAIAIFATTIALAAFGILPIAVAAMGGALAMIGSSCINIRQASRAIDQKIIMIIAAALAMGHAMAVTGGANFIADNVIALLGDASALVVISGFFLLVAILTNVLSNNATAVLFTPIAISVAQRIGVEPEVFVIALIFASKCSFATPFGYQTNLLVMGPGHYRFLDFVRAGLPLTVIMWLTFTAIAAFYYGF